MMQADPFFEKLCLEITKTLDNIQNNNHVYSRTLKLCECLRVGPCAVLPVIASLLFMQTHTVLCVRT